MVVYLSDAEDAIRGTAAPDTQREQKLWFRVSPAKVFDGVMRIGVISDTHGLLRPEALSGLAGVEHIIHAGEIGSVEIVPRLREIAPVTAIRGNVDTQAWASAFHERETVKLAGHTI